jgi:hypothetical protein
MRYKTFKVQLTKDLLELQIIGNRKEMYELIKYMKQKYNAKCKNGWFI